MTRPTDRAVQGILAALFAFGLALICAPIYAVLHRNERVRLETWDGER